MSTATVAPLVAPSATVSADDVTVSSASADARFQQRLAAEHALRELELAVQDLRQRFFAPTVPRRRSLSRRSRRSAWLPNT
ncbi:MAG: hypothetical protein ACR2IK_12810 [Chloroflexota bacterium]